MYPTQNDLDVRVRTRMVELLNDRLSATIDLFNQAKQAHWNVKGPAFRALHELFDDVAEHVEEWSDTIAERAVALGGNAEGTTQRVAERTSLPAYPLELQAGSAHVEAFSKVLAAYAALVRGAIQIATDAGDADTADLFTEISREADKDLWMVEAHHPRYT
ncbi:DNA starvation/stationary phase protection protein Dps [Sandaracinus amylolyticus]|nr:DNA starvation/stationary phase protection protein Dps [Sandaracinus amylolyticus]